MTRTLALPFVMRYKPTKMQNRSNWLQTGLTAAIPTLVGFIMLATSPVQAQFQENFDAGSVSWSLIETDCHVLKSKWLQNRKQEDQRTYEQIYFQSGPGTKTLVAHRVTPAFVIPELNAEVTIRSNQPGARLMARVILPHSARLDENQPVTTYISGPEYRGTGQWTTLKFNAGDLAKSLREKLWLLRRQYGPQITLQNAYVDQIVLNTYNGPGTVDIHIDTLKLNSIVSAEKTAQTVRIHGSVRQTAGETIDDPNVIPVAATQTEERQPSLITRDGTVLLANEKPIFATIIQHNGESFAFLKSLGFNTIQLRATATPQQLREARQLGLWLVCPPPSSIGISSIPFAYDPVMAWSLGENKTLRDLQNIQATIREIHESDLRKGRPVVCNVNSHWALLGREIDILSIGLEPVGTSFIASGYSDWIQDRARAAGTNTVWVDLQTEYTVPMQQQAKSIAPDLPPTPLEVQQIQFLAYEALAGGARGIRCLSRNRLDQEDPATRLRALTLSHTLNQLNQLAPWAAGGAVRGELQLKDDQLEVTALDTSRSRLLLIQRPTHREQYWAGDRPTTTVAFRDSSAAFTDRAYQLTPAGLNPVPHEREPSGTQIKIENCPFATAVVLTQDPMVVSRLNSAYDNRPGQATQMQQQMELTRQWLAIMQLVEGQLGNLGRSSPAASGALNEAVNAMRQANRLQLASSDSIGLKYVTRTNERLAFVRRELMTEPLGDFSSKTSTPLLTHLSLLPLHWQLATYLQQSNWKPNSLPGGDFENLEHMTQAGWRNRRLEMAGIETKVELAKDAMAKGTYGLKISCNGDPAVGVLPTTPVWITSAPVAVKSGQLVRIHGWANVPNVIARSQDGLTITDSLGGPQLAERIPVTEGWQEFTIYRGVPQDGNLTVTLGLTGIGEARVDEVTIRVVDLPAQGVRQARKQ